MKIAIIGAAYTGMEAARYLKSPGAMTISVTTTSERIGLANWRRLPTALSSMRGNDREKMRRAAWPARMPCC